MKIKKYQNPSGSLTPVQGLRTLRRTQQPISRQQRQQSQANRLNGNNNIGNLVGKVSEGLLGKPMSENKQNEITLQNSSRDALGDSMNYYGSQEYKNRLRSANVNMSNSNRLQNRLGTVNTYSIGEETAQKMRANTNGNGIGPTFRGLTMYNPMIIGGKRYNPGVYYNRGTMHDGLGENVYGTFAHEYSHWVDKALTPDARAYNRSLIRGNLNPNLTPKEKSYFGSDTEIRARGMDILMNYNNNKSKYKDLDDFLDKEGQMKGMMELRKTFKDENSFRNYMHHFVLNDNPGINQNNVYYAKKGIHIKKKNRGKFTDYCGGKVTNACISRAKASGNPTLVKRATFAANARKWKH